ncbi:hypothetical protein KDA_51180 [Dictyobacter alpinus]|uniref:Xyloglucanase n=1 Tax=Dictyobacter alpinus TaxID=2014873 RepID=A0A402BE29_9CHLR|nr:hypothetical protein [Dictyobacter alpinus]GCE29634.1 hypothetical protein KDA_51180 [Dictyobacter alpinus]
MFYGFRQRRVRAMVALVSVGLLTMMLFVSAKFYTANASNSASTPDYTWKQLKVGGGGYITGMALHPTVAGLIYIRTDVGGAYKLGPNDTWQQLITASAVPNPTPNDYSVESLAVSASNAQTLYLAVGNDLNSQNGRILKSTNQGQSFTDSGQRWTMGGNADYRQGGERLAVDPHNDNVVYFGSRTEGLWVSTDGAQTWSQVSTSSVPVGTNSGTPAGDKFVLFDPNSGTTNGKTNRIYVGVAGLGVYLSNDAGATWSNVVPVSSTQFPFSASMASDGTLYVGINATSGAGAVEKYVPATNVATVISPSTGANDYEVAADPHNSQRVIVGSGGFTGGNLWRTTNGGSSWDTLENSVSSSTIPWIASTNESDYLSSALITFDPFVADKLWFPQGTGVWYSTDNTGSTIHWNFYSKGIEEVVANDLIAAPGDAPISNIFDRQGFYHADVDSYPAQTLVDNTFWGGTSLDYSGGHPGTIVTIQVKNNYYPSLTGRGATSTDGGKTWKLFGSTPDNNVGGNIAISATDTNNLVWLPSTGNFGQGNSPYYSTDGGQSWHQSTGIVDPKDSHWLFWWGSKRALTSDKVNNAFYAITFSPSNSQAGSFYTSTDGGKTFVEASNSPACEQNGDCHVFGQIHAAPGEAGHVWSSGAKDGLWYTTNAGQTPWTKVPNVQEARSFGFGKALPGSSYPAIYLYGKANGDSAFGIYRSADQGATWSLLSAAPLGIYDQVNVTTGDMNRAGRVYVGFSGNGFAYGDDQNIDPSATPTPTPTPLPLPWQHQDIGVTGKAGSASYHKGIFSVSGSGADIGGTADSFQYVYQPFSGDGTIIARVDGLQNTDPWAKAGVMIRESLNENACFADVLVTPGKGTVFERRSTPGSTAVSTAGSKGSAPYWVKLTRAKNTFTAYVSNNGTGWKKVGSTTLTMSQSAYIGLAVTAHNTSKLNTAKLSKVSLSITYNSVKVRGQ